MKKTLVLILSISFSGATLFAQEPVAKDKSKSKTECTKGDKSCCKPGNLRAKKKTTDNKAVAAAKSENKSVVKQN